MQWLHATRSWRSFQSGRAAWTSAGSPRFASWRWPAPPFGALLIQVCPLEEFCVARETSYPYPVEMGRAPRAEGAGSQSAWRFAEDWGRG
jgi:hypothetical protein